MKIWEDAQIQGSSEKCEIKHQCNAILGLSHTQSVTLHFSQVVEMMDAPSVPGTWDGHSEVTPAVQVKSSRDTVKPMNSMSRCPKELVLMIAFLSASKRGGMWQHVRRQEYIMGK